MNRRRRAASKRLKCNSSALTTKKTELLENHSFFDVLKLIRAAMSIALHICTGAQKRISPHHRRSEQAKQNNEMKTLLGRISRMIALLESKWKRSVALLDDMKDIIVSQRFHLHRLQSSGNETTDMATQTAHIMETHMSSIGVQTDGFNSFPSLRAQRDRCERLTVKLAEKEAEHKHALCRIADLESSCANAKSELHQAKTKLQSQSKIIERLHKIIEAQRRMKEKFLTLHSSALCSGELKHSRPPLHGRPPRPETKAPRSERVESLSSSSDEERTDDSYDELEYT